MASVLMQSSDKLIQRFREAILRLELALLSIVAAAGTVRGQVPRARVARLNRSPEVIEQLIQQRNHAAKPPPAEVGAFGQRLNLQLRASSHQVAMVA